MAHMMKHTKASCGHMFAHFDRKAEHIGNENLDRTRTHLNYNLATHQQMDQGEFVRKRCSEVRCQNRKDVNVMVSWVVTAPKDLPEQEHRAFFQASYDFLQKRYGKENVVSAYVHMDESQPHLHFAFVPVVHDAKRDWDKVSAKEAVNRRDLQTFHADLQKHVESVLGHEVGILNEATKEGNRSIQELKRDSAAKKLKSIETEIAKHENTLVRLSEAQIGLKKAEGDVIDLEGKKNALKGQIKALNEEYNQTLPKVEQAKRDLTACLSMVKQVKKASASYVHHEAKEGILGVGAKEAYWEVPDKDIKKVVEAGKSVDNALKVIDQIGTAQMIIQNREKIIADAEEKAKHISLQQKMAQRKDAIELRDMKELIARSPELTKALEQAKRDKAIEDALRTADHSHSLGLER